ncbi:hypothetical protein SELMODRAFT_447462 [Selaginella moellendorffii]|uniref:Uncharacterized protein n=1 Tax=Selaginella moellendorffii TaxID=88036 RepID=D8SZP3_SELML|nr:stress-related protein [Selaginella moellendorffii]EFJ10055.1 hypothetical protein SELMODRAFT_447462 [Selaginella moellendorffii]|eukprot:XP_002988793.1 stress-related protein [Selaginella moellendorffii]
MAEQQPAPVESTQEPKLKYLGFFQAALIKVTVVIASLYEFAKENSGPLKPGVDSVEGTVKTVVAPVLHKIEGRPAELLILVDSKVDEIVTALKNSLPQFVKERSQQAYDIVTQAPEAARSVVGDVQKRGVYESARDYYNKYEPVAEEWSYSAWTAALKLPVVPQVVHLTAPVALFGVEKFNSLVVVLKENNVPLAAYVPELPLEKIQRAVEMEPVKQA